MRILLAGNQKLQYVYLSLKKIFPYAEINRVGSQERMTKKLVPEQWDLFIFQLKIIAPSINKWLSIFQHLLPGTTLIAMVNSKNQMLLDTFQEKNENVQIAGILKENAGRNETEEMMKHFFSEGMPIKNERQIKQESQIKLSPREKQILAFMLRGSKRSFIARELSITEHTISTYRERILKKLQLKNALELKKYLDNLKQNPELI